MKNFILLGISIFTLNTHTAFAIAPQISCASPPPISSYNISQTPANNVPLYQCYAIGGECLYNATKPAATGWDLESCPTNIGGSNCCRWKTQPTPTPTPVPPPCPNGGILVSQPVNGTVVQLCCTGTGITKWTPTIGTINYHGPYCCTPKAIPAN